MINRRCVYFSCLLIFSVLFSCNNSVDSCGEIDRKYEKNGEYFFAMILEENDSNNSNVGGGRIYSDISVTKKVYDLNKPGDFYCVEE